MTEFVVATLGAMIGGIITYLLAIQRAQLDLIVKVDEATRKDRVEAYKKLWSLTGKLPRYPAEPVDYSELDTLSKALRNWYFCEGGIYLSENSREVYFDVQRLLMQQAKLAGALNPYDDKGDYNETGDYEKIRSQLSALRTQLTEDIGSRRAPGLSQIASASSQTKF